MLTSSQLALIESRARDWPGGTIVFTVWLAERAALLCADLRQWRSFAREMLQNCETCRMDERASDDSSWRCARCQTLVTHPKVVSLDAKRSSAPSVARQNVPAELTPQQAADVLNVSQLYLLKLLDAGEVPCRQNGADLYIDEAGLFEYKRQDDQRRKAIADALDARSQELGLDD